MGKSQKRENIGIKWVLCLAGSFVFNRGGHGEGAANTAL
jgi:hypothetical protein